MLYLLGDCVVKRGEERVEEARDLEGLRNLSMFSVCLFMCRRKNESCI